MSAATTKIVKWAAAGCVVAIIAVIGYFTCLKAAPKVAKETTARGQDVYPTSLTYVVKATVKGKGAAAPKPATIKCEIENSSLCLAKTQLIENKSVIIDRGGQTVQFSVNLLDNSAGFFRPAFKVPAGVVVENIEVTESPAANGEPELTIVEGTILERSALPDPEKSDYPDCRFTCHFKGNSIIKGKPCPQELSLILEGFADRKLLGTKDLKPGDHVICIAMPFNKLPQERQTTQQADDLNLFSMESYYAIDIRKIKIFRDMPEEPSSGVAFSKMSTNNQQGNLDSDKMCFGLDAYPTSTSCVIQATINNKNAVYPKSTMEFGIRGTGMCHPVLQMSQTQTINRGENQSISMPVNLLGNIGFFQPAFKIPEGVAVENIEVNESPAANGEPELTIVEGTILERSALPDPEKSDYPDCRFTCHFKGNSIVKGKPCPQELSLIVEGFADRKLLGTKDLKAGDRVMCIALPFGKLPQERQTTQQADDLNLFSLASYYAIDVRKINEFSDLAGTPSSGIAFTDASDKPYVSVFERHVNPPIKEEFRKAQQEAIAQELQKIEAMLAPYTPEKIAELRQKFAQVWEAEKAKDLPNYNRVVMGKTEYVWRNVENSFWALPTNYRLPEYKEEPIAPYNLEALISLRDFLEANGCQFLISAVPSASEIAVRVINTEFRNVPDFQTAYVAKQLLQHGIETFYPSKILIDNFHRYQLAYYYPHDAHPHNTTQDVMTDIVAKKLLRYHFVEQLDQNLFIVKSISLSDNPKNPYRFPVHCDIGMNAPGTIYPCRQVWYDDKVLCTTNDKAQILVIGNSFMRTPAWLPNAETFPTLLSSKLHVNIQGQRLEGWGPLTTTIQQLFSSPKTMLSKKTIVILAIGIGHLRHTNVFNDIRRMDNYAKSMSKKKMIGSYEVKSNIGLNDPKIPTNFHAKQPITNPIFFEIPANGTTTLAETAIANIDSNKPVTIVIPTSLDANRFAKYVVNEQDVIIPRGYDIYRHLNAFCELPAGTDRLKVELVGKPGTILSICNIQVYQ